MKNLKVKKNGLALLSIAFSAALVSACDSSSQMSNPNSHDIQSRNSANTSAIEVTELKCEFQSLNSTQAPFWKVVNSEYISPTRMALPAVLDTSPMSLGGSSPERDSMIFCSTSTISPQPDDSVQINVTTKRIKTVSEIKCSQLDSNSVVSTQTESFGLDGTSSIDYRFYGSDGTSQQRRIVNFFGNSTEFGSFDQSTAEAKCEQIGSGMDAVGI